MSKYMRISLMVAVAVCFAAAMAGSAFANHAHVATNDDNPDGNTTSVFYWNGSSLTAISGSPFSTGGYGYGGGYFGIPREAIAVGSNGNCLFVGDAYNSSFGASDIASFKYASHALSLVGDYTSEYGYSGAEYGLGLAVSGNTLIANYTASGVQEQWTIGSGCTLSETGNTITAYGGNGGVADGMLATSNCYYYAGADGTVSYATMSPFTYGGSVTAGGYDADGGLPTDLQTNGTYLYADDLGGTTFLVDVWSLNSNCSLTNNVTNGPLSDSLYGSNTMSLSPNGAYLFGVGTFSGTVTTADVSGSSVTSSSCTDVSLPGYGSSWIYPGASALQNNNKGAGGWQFIAEASFGYTSTSYVAINDIDSSNGCLTYNTNVAEGSEYTLSLASHTD